MHVDGVARDGNDWLLQDAVGSVRATVDQAGVVSAETAFTAFGEPLTGDADSFGFAGEQLDTTGLLHLRARQYNPTVGRFNTVDPVQPGAPGTTGYNLYTYAANNPTTFTDPTGQAVLGEYAALVGDQADLAEIISSGVGNCATASFSRAVAGLDGYQLGEDPGQAVLRDCATGTGEAILQGIVFSAGGRAVGEGLEAVGRFAGDIRTGSRALPAGPPPPRALTPGPADNVSSARFSVDANGHVTDLSRADLVTVFRVESPANARLVISDSGDVSIRGDNALFLNFGDGTRAVGTQQSRLADGFEGTEIFAFDVPTSFLDELRRSSVPEEFARTDFPSPFRVDTEFVDQFGLRSCSFAALERAIVEGSGRRC